MPISRKDAISVLTKHLRAQARKKREKRQLGEQPKVYEMSVNFDTNSVIESIRGPVSFETHTNAAAAPTDPRRYAFFVDEKPEANWEHPCKYIIIRDSGTIEEANETLPPKLAATNGPLVPLEITGI